METIETSKQPQAIVPLITPARLGQGDGAIPEPLAKRRRTAVLPTKELLIPLIDAPDDVLDGLRIELLPMGKPRHALQLRDMAFQPIVADVAVEAPIVAFLHGDEMIVDAGCQVDLGMQMAQPLGAIKLKDQGTPCHLYAFLRVAVALDHFQRDRTHRRKELRACPHAGQAFLQPWKLCPQSMRHVAFDLPNNLGDTDLRVDIKQEMDVIRHDFHNEKEKGAKR